jgi:hypothetical protein
MHIHPAKVTDVPAIASTAYGYLPRPLGEGRSGFPGA